MKWQPIETAPKDGTLVILYQPNIYDFYGNLNEPETIMIASWTLEQYLVREPYYCWMVPNTTQDEQGGSWELKPTHWMLLPEKPNL